jgi:hypothetical protein
MDELKALLALSYGDSVKVKVSAACVGACIARRGLRGAGSAARAAAEQARARLPSRAR